MSQFSWGLSQQNRRTLVIDGHEFTKKTGNTEWKHSLEVLKTTSITRNNDLFFCRNEHTHEVFLGRLRCKASRAENGKEQKNSESTSQWHHYSKLPAVCVRRKRPFN